jgi:hypothetical protein
MSIPLDRLYHYIEQTLEEIFNDNVIIYRFWPHGSKNLDDFGPLKKSYNFSNHMLLRNILCVDQEPLDYDYYKNQRFSVENHASLSEMYNVLRKLGFEHLLLVSNIGTNFCPIHNYILLHSEKRSRDIMKYQNDNFTTVYYWSHAIIARDWFRYAQHVTQHKQVNKIFLIYNRAWSGTREYRLKFTEHLIRLGLQDLCQTSVNPIEPELGIHYEFHNFKNPTWRPATVLENYFPLNTAPSHYSADFDMEDYEATDIEVVLETLFDDSRLHLTEKSLRPIACGQPFILAGTHGSLEYLRSYGFKTFEHIWNEEYDLIKCPEERLARIADLMQQIANWTPRERVDKMSQAQVIADYNQQHFFSQKFFNQVNHELKDNLKLVANLQVNLGRIKTFIKQWEQLLTYPEIINFLQTNTDIMFPTTLQANLVLEQAKKLLTCSNKDPVPILR